MLESKHVLLIIALGLTQDVNGFVNASAKLTVMLIDRTYQSNKFSCVND